MADRAEVHANLVCPSRVNGDAGQGQRAAEMLGADDPRDGFAAAPCPCRHLLTVHRISADRLIDAASGLHLAPYEGRIDFFNLSILELSAKLYVGRIVLGDDHQSRRAAVEPVHDARTFLTAD